MARPAFPTNDLDFDRRFPDEASAIAYVVASRYPNGWECPKCGHEKSYERADRPRAVECARCGRIASVTAGTVLHNAKVPLRIWLRAAWNMVVSKRGLSALELARRIGVTYETAFTMLHKLRQAMVAPDRTLLSGRVEVDETYVGGPEPGPRGRGAQGKALVVGAVEVRSEAPQRIRLRVIESAEAATLHPFVRDVIERGTVLVTDGWRGYANLAGYRREEMVVGRDGLEPKDVLKFFHTAVGNLKAWLMGTHHGGVRKHHLQAYLDEYAFRFNRRGNLAAAFQTLLGLVPRVEQLTYERLYSGVRKHPKSRRRRAHTGR